jgi:hypothetical protein
MEIERVRLNVTLKAGDKIWLEGEVLTSPLPLEIHQEILDNTGNVEVLDFSGGPSTTVKNTVIAVPKFKDSLGNEPRSTSTSFEMKEVEPKRVKRAKING